MSSFTLKILHAKWIPLVKGGATLKVQVSSSTTILQLKQLIIKSNKETMYASLQNPFTYFIEKSSLMYAGKVLDRERYTLTDYDIGPGSVLSFAHWYTFNVPLSKYKLAIFTKAFNNYDVDGSGEIDANELFILVNELGMSRTKSQCIEMVDQVDEDGSGEIDFEEFCTMMVKVMQDDLGMFEKLENVDTQGTEEEQRERDSGALICWDPGYPGQNDPDPNDPTLPRNGKVRFDAETNAYVFADVDES